MSLLFLTTTTFEFLGDSVVEAFNSGLKSGHDHVNTNMTINTSAAEQIYIVNKQNKTKRRYVVNLHIINDINIY